MLPRNSPALRVRSARVLHPVSSSDSEISRIDHLTQLPSANGKFVGGFCCPLFLASSNTPNHRPGDYCHKKPNGVLDRLKASHFSWRSSNAPQEYFARARFPGIIQRKVFGKASLQ